MTCFLMIRRVDEIKYGMAQDLVHLIPQHLREAIVHISCNCGGINNPDCFLSGFQYVAVSLLAYLKRFLRKLVLGAVVSDRQYRRASAEFRKCGIGINPACRVALGNQFELSPRLRTFTALNGKNTLLNQFAKI